MLGERLGNVLFILTSISEERDKVSCDNMNETGNYLRHRRTCIT